MRRIGERRKVGHLGQDRREVKERRRIDDSEPPWEKSTEEKGQRKWGTNTCKE